MPKHRRRIIAVFVLIPFVLGVTSCSSSKPRSAPQGCGSVHTEFSVNKEVVLNTPISGNLAIDSELRKAFVAYRKRDDSGGVLTVSLDGLAITDDMHGTWPAGALALDANSHLLYVTDGKGSIAVVDVKTGKQQRTLEVQGQASDLTVDSDAHTLYYTNSNNDIVYAVNPQTAETITAIELPFHPSALTFGGSNHLVYAASTGSESGGNVAIIDATRKAVVATTAVKGSDGGLAVDAANRRVLTSSSYYGVISAIDDASGKVTEQFTGFNTPHSMLRCGDLLFVANRDPGEVVIADSSTGRIAQTLSVGTHPEAIAVDAKTGNVWVLSQGDTARTTPGLLSIVAPKH